MQYFLTGYLSVSDIGKAEVLKLVEPSEFSQAWKHKAKK